jgi:predicted ATP-grasp superfamily ATP-dependent carboligase
MANPNRPPQGPFDLNIVGASARAAAFSAMRAGASVTASDLFGDEDLRAAARFAEPAGSYPRSLAAALRRMPAAPFIYTGGLENHPEIVDDMARRRPLWGNPGPVLRRARDPFLLAGALRAAGVLVPRLRRADDPPARLAGWLRKPTGGSGGRGIALAERGRCPRRGPFYYQRFVAGPSCSALYAAGPGGARFLGATRQLVGVPWLHAPPFAWCGGIGPAALPERATAAIRAAGDALAAAFRLRGLFGLDFLLEGEEPRPVDLNPRYTASAEVLEHALGFSAVALHREAFTGPGHDPAPGGAAPAAPPAGREPAGGAIGKAVLFAPRRLVLAEDLARLRPADPWRLPTLADIPARGRTVERGRPLLTVFARAGTEADCLRALERAATAAFRHFQAAPASSSASRESSA